MSEQWWTIIGAVMSVFAVIGIGVTTRQIGWLSEEADQSLYKLIIRVLLPCLIFSVVSNNPTLRHTKNLLLPPIIGFSTLLLGMAVAMLVARLPASWHGLEDERRRRTFALSVGVYNWGFVPIPLVKLLFDDNDQTLGVLFIHNVGAELAIWTVGVALLLGGLSRGWWRHMINPPGMAIVVALLFNFLHASEHLPWFLSTAVRLLGQAAIPMAMILVGATIADQLRPNGNLQSRSDRAKTIAWSCLLRLGLLPLAFLAIAALVPAAVELRRVIVIEAAMPSAVFPILLARIYKGDPGTALRVTLGTSILGLVTIPLWIAGGMMLLEYIGAV